MSDAMNFDREGTFRGEIIEYGLQDAKESKSVAVVVKCQVHEAYNFETETWEDWRQWNMEGYGNVWVIKKDGTINEKSAESLMRHAGWSGSLNDIVTGDWKPTPVQFVVKSETYKNQTQYKVAFINGYDSTPGGGIRSVDPDKAKELQLSYGSQFRALAGNVKAKEPPKGKPSAPPAAAGAAPAEKDGIPF